MVIIVLNVSVNTNSEWGGFRAPIYSDGTFKFVPIPLKDCFVVDPICRSDRWRSLGLEEIVPADKLDRRDLLSPDFKNLAYGHMKLKSKSRRPHHYPCKMKRNGVFFSVFFVWRMFVLNAIVCLKNLGGMFEGVYFFSVVSMLNMESANLR